MARTKARRQHWKKALLNISQKYPESPEAIKALEMIEQIKGTDSIGKNNITYLNYKWIFTFKHKDTATLKKIKNKLQDALNESPDLRWFLSEDRFNKDQTYLVLHGIRNRRKLNEWKKRFEGAEQELIKTNKKKILLYTFLLNSSYGHHAYILVNIDVLKKRHLKQLLTSP